MKKYNLMMAMLVAAHAPLFKAEAGETPETVVELFTSQGCSSCPPANEFVGSLAGDEDKLVLSYGVTYWDFLGWKDTFGDPEFTRRQKDYGRALNISSVYTPQIVLNGRDHAARYKRRDVESADLTLSKNVMLDITETDGFLTIDTNADNVLIVCYTPGWQKIEVKRGENGGRTLRVANVVDRVETLSKFGKTSIPVDPNFSYAALVHDRDSHQIIAASVLRPNAGKPSRN